jgi:hypothetical protein
MPYAAVERNKPVDRLDIFDLSSDGTRTAKYTVDRGWRSLAGQLALVLA